MRWICSQIGAREHYAIPRVLHRAGKLESLYTDFWANHMWQELGKLTGQSSLAARYHRDLEGASVKSFDLTTLVDSVFGGSQKNNSYKWFSCVGHDFALSVVESLRRKKAIDWRDVIFFGYDTGFLESAQWVRSRGGKTIVSQMDPSRFEVDLMKDEEKLWPGWAKRSLEVPEAFSARRKQEWAVADLVMVNSEWTKVALMKQGVSADKIVIVPLAYEVAEVERRGSKVESIGSAENSLRPSTLDSRRILRVLFLGQVILRKGIQYLIQAAKLLQDESIFFDVVGPIGITDEALQSAPSNMTFHGAISRDKASEYFLNADIFVLPTLSDGFALTQIEAMAYGLPVITTLNCGEVVSDGSDGLIVPVRDVEKLAGAIRFLITNPEKFQRMGASARQKSGQFSLARLGENLEAIEKRLKVSS